MPPRVRAITFDAGDTLIFDRPSMQERVALALAEVGLRFDEGQLAPAVRKMMAVGMGFYLAGHALDEPIVVAQCTREMLHELAVPSDDPDVYAVAHAYGTLAYERYADDRLLKLISVLRERGFKTGIISDWEPDLPDLLESHSCSSLLDSISVSSIVGVTKPSKKLFEDAAAKLEVTASQIIHVGDYLELDVAGAEAAGMGAILYDWKRFYDNELALKVPIARTFTELESLLLSLPVP